MLPTLQDGDFILVNKAAYGLRLPVIGTRLIGDGKPERGDVAVFRYPPDPSQDYIKRIIGLPGDEIRYADGTVLINGQPLEREGGEPYTGPEVKGSAVLWHEHVDERTYPILHHKDAQRAEFTYTVPEGAYFALGDNRDRSADSRHWGTVPDDNLAGRAFVIWMSWDTGGGGIAWDRIGQQID